MTASGWPNCSAAQGHARGRRWRGRRPGRAQHLPHPRESRGKGLFRRRPAAARGRLEAADRARRLRRPGRRRGSDAPLADDRHGRRPAGLSSPARDDRRGRARRASGRYRHAGDLASSTRCPRAAGRAPSAFLTVQEGCDKFCTYCVVPYTRGAEISRPWGDIVAEAHALVDARRARDRAARPECECLERRRARPRRPDPRAREDRWRWSGSATPPATRPT